MRAEQEDRSSSSVCFPSLHTQVLMGPRALAEAGPPGRLRTRSCPRVKSLQRFKTQRHVSIFEL